MYILAHDMNILSPKMYIHCQKKKIQNLSLGRYLFEKVHFCT